MSMTLNKLIEVQENSEVRHTQAVFPEDRPDENFDVRALNFKNKNRAQGSTTQFSKIYHAMFGSMISLGKRK